MQFWADPTEGLTTCSRPGIYRFVIEGEGQYVGRYTRASRPLREYRRAVSRLLAGQPYRRGKPDGFRRVHRALHRAVLNGRAVNIEIVENVQLDQLNARERYWIGQVPMAERLNGRAPA